MSIPLNRPYIRRKDWDQVLDTMMQDHWEPSKHTATLETEFSRYWKTSSAWAFRSNADAIRYLFRGMKLAPGDSVLLSPLSNPVWREILLEFHATPTYVDVLSDSPVLDVQAVEPYLEQNPRAILVDNSLGYIPDWTAFKKLGIFLIEDLSQGLGGLRDAALCGTNAEVVFYSLGTDGLITAGLGAMLAIRSKRYLEEFFFQKPLDDDRLPDPLAALALSLWSSREELIQKKQENHRYLFQHLSRSHRQPRQYGDAEIVPTSFALLPERGAKEIKMYAIKKGVECVLAYHKQAEIGLEFDNCPHARYFLHHTLIFPLLPVFSAKEAQVYAKVLSTLP
jgi:dTDP-4-amino-4,6-dideoxygalactose transaminase